MPNDMTDDPLNNEANVSESKSADLLSHLSYEELLQKLDETEQKTNEYWERILRMQADAENVTRRTERDIANAHKFALEKFVAEILPIVDSLELSIQNVPKDTASVAVAVMEGVELTLKMFYSALEKFGIKQVYPVSKPFDSTLHQAISMQEDDKVKPGMVISVLQKGYTLHGRLIRPALVIVAKTKDIEIQ